MGSDFYSYTVIGVKASKYAKDKTVTYKVQKKVGDVYRDETLLLVFDANGDPVMMDVSAEYVEFLDKNYRRDYIRKGCSEIGGVKLEETEFQEYLSLNGLEWFSYDFNRIFSGDVIGIKICENDTKENGIALDKLPELIARVKQLLEALGITEEPRLFACLYHSY